MSISTMEDLEALEVGTKVWVSGCPTRREYERTETGWRINGSVLRPGLFAGLVASGQVHLVDTAPVSVRDVFRDCSHGGPDRWARVLVVGSVDYDKQRVRAGYFRRTVFYSEGEYTFDQVWGYPWVRVPVAEQEPWMTSVFGVVQALARLQLVHDLTMEQHRETLRVLRTERQQASRWTASEVRIIGDFTVERVNG